MGLMNGNLGNSIVVNSAGVKPAATVIFFVMMVVAPFTGNGDGGNYKPRINADKFGIHS